MSGFRGEDSKVKNKQANNGRQMAFGQVSLKSVIHYLYHEKKVLGP
jgi:hypothetical protein